MEETWLTLVMSTCRVFRDEELVVGVPGEVGLFMSHRIAKKPTRATAMI